jgi:type 1 glutamine amidotransferase
MRILVLSDDRWHPAKTPRAGLQPLESEFELEWVENTAGFDSSRLVSYPLVILTKSNNISQQDETPWMTPAMEEAFDSYVRGGGGLLVIHSGLAGYDQSPVLRALMGGIFDHHPEQCLVEVAPVPGETLASGLKSFTVRDEHYFMTIDDPNLSVFLTSASEHGAQSAGWTRKIGKGRVCILTPGHNPEVWLHPVYQTAIRQSIQWCQGVL